MRHREEVTPPLEFQRRKGRNNSLKLDYYLKIGVRKKTQRDKRPAALSLKPVSGCIYCHAHSSMHLKQLGGIRQSYLGRQKWSKSRVGTHKPPHHISQA